MPDKNETPWADDLAAAFEDETAREAVNEFLADKVQPYVTKIEQEARPNRDATRLWDELNTDPSTTTVQVVRELWGDDIADKFVGILKPDDEAPETDTVETDTDTTPAVAAKPTLADLPPEVQDAIATVQQEKQKKLYFEELDRVEKEHADDLPKDEDGKPVLDQKLFHPFVAATGGDFDQAWAGFEEFMNTAKQRFGIDVGDAAEIPATLDSSTRNAAQTKPATEKDYKGDLDAAFDDFFKEQETAPPTV